MKVIEKPISWEPLNLNIYTGTVVGEQYVSRVCEVVQNALNARDGRKECNCTQQFLDVSQQSSHKIRVLCEWLCPICLPKILKEMEQNLANVKRMEVGLAHKPDTFKGQFLLIPDKKILVENGEFLFVGKFSISLRETSVGEFSVFCEETQYKTVAERQGSKSTYRYNSALWDFSSEARLNKVATHISFNDAQAYCKWSGKRLPTEAEFLAAALIDCEIRKTYDSKTEHKVGSLIASGMLPTFTGASITSTVGDGDMIVMRSGPKYIMETGWESQERYQRHLRKGDYFDATTTFHVCERVA